MKKLQSWQSGYHRKSERGNFSTISMALIKRKLKQPNPINMDQAVL